MFLVSLVDHTSRLRLVNKRYIPFTFTTKEERDFNFEKRPVWFKPQADKVLIDLNEYDAYRNVTTNQSWIIANVKHTGFYRVNYDEANWRLLIEQLESGDHEVIDVVSRAQLIDDAFNLGRAELVDQLLFLNITRYLVNETSIIPLIAALQGQRDNQSSSAHPL